ncbi:hypothetical protein C8R46DRAFT_1053737 [Mycena filopes]|nr:hypothetical protein C8R46DRAFT_1053737 [Mycena filopes]
MAPLTDTQHGYGRRNRNNDSDDSSSSRDTSPVRKVKRSFTPTSDDDIVVEPVGEDDTPPPEGPLIRQAVAFSWTPSIPTAPTSINTYQASPIPTQQNFLPGQAVAAPPPKPPPKPRKKTKKRSAPQFSAQTGRFRIGTYDPTPTTEPALSAGEGPYASMYRATDKPAVPTEGQAPAPTGTRKRAKPSEPKPKASTSKVKANPKSSTSKSKASASKRGASSNMAQPEPEFGGSHYRRDYAPEHAGSSTGGSPSPKPDHRRLPVPKPSPLRLVTILIEDNRGEVPDSQLAEVHVRLRDSANPKEDGFWANAEDICKALQGSPSRIDGPAKIFVWRGKYRHIILKVNADNRDEWVTANVVITPERTLSMIVETGLPLGAPAPPAIPQAPRENLAPNPYGSMGTHGIGPIFTNPEHPSRKRQHSPDEFSSGRRPPSILPPRTSSTSTHHPNPGPSGARMTLPDPASPVPQMQDTRYSLVDYFMEAEEQIRTESQDQSRSSSVDSEDDPEVVHARVTEEVDVFLQSDRSWVDFFKWSGRSTVAILNRYRVFQGLVDRWAWHSHIALALKVDADAAEREKYMSDCAETLGLMALYGPEGQRLQDPDVVQKA